ncbi:cytotoxic translational repressor of toxin-antitoxin stability system [Serpentinimonas raichei]|uniref:Cytotoxic translational repressor of toxin-antitoxin stability system n=1 Tax=Serpentinimonas raichei TaxID=1458425 RepID=A0A060NGV4_9BURK|nr:type II toxin-antitoxin system RelE/ParE family toxin [Serpentinimonas raichei]BAO80232.1 cytotoxic translational repressor of toxin-antitoxin stability system [Serpentinimonas raichei]
MEVMVFVELPIFIRCAAELFADEDIAALQNTLLENPAAGDLIPGGRGLRKLRVPLPGRGKRSGARVIYYHWVSKEQCYLIYAYAKNVSTNLTPVQLRRLAEIMQAEIPDE